MAVTSKLALEEFLGLEETEPGSEYACGEVIQKPMPTYVHAKLQTFLVAVLFPFLARTGLGDVLTEFRCIFGPPGRQRAFLPDLVYVATEHNPARSVPPPRTGPRH